MLLATTGSVAGNYYPENSPHLAEKLSGKNLSVTARPASVHVWLLGSSTASPSAMAAELEVRGGDLSVARGGWIPTNPLPCIAPRHHAVNSTVELDPGSLLHCGQLLLYAPEIPMRTVGHGHASIGASLPSFDSFRVLRCLLRLMNSLDESKRSIDNVSLQESVSGGRPWRTNTFRPRKTQKDTEQENLLFF